MIEVEKLDKDKLLNRLYDLYKKYSQFHASAKDIAMALVYDILACRIKGIIDEINEGVYDDN